MPNKKTDLCNLSPGKVAHLIAQSEMFRLGDSVTFGQTHASLKYHNDLFSLGLIRLGELLDDAECLSFGEGMFSTFVDEKGEFRMGSDGITLNSYPAGVLLMEAFTRTGEVRYRRAAEIMRHQLRSMVRTRSGVFAWKPSQIWLDGLWMLNPFYAMWGKASNDTEVFDDLARQYTIVAECNRDPRTGLFYHGYDELRDAFWADRLTGRSPSVWARAQGWYAMSLVEILDHIPAQHEARALFLRLLNELVPVLVRFQDLRSRIWFQVVDQNDRPGNYTETSASAMYIYTIAKAVRCGYVDPNYLTAAKLGYEGLVREKMFIDGYGNANLAGTVQSAGLGASVHFAQLPPPNSRQVESTMQFKGPVISARDLAPGGRDGSFDYYVNQPIVTNNFHGLGPFLMASVEMQRLEDSNV